VQILAEAVRVAIEVKSSLTKFELRNAIEKLSQASQQVKDKGSRDTWPPHYLSCLFAYRGPIKPNTIIKWLAEIANEWPEDFPIAKRPFVPNCIIVLENYVLIAEPYLRIESASTIDGLEFPTKKTECSLIKMHEIIERRLELRIGATLEHLVDRGGGYPPDMKSSSWPYPPRFTLLQG
jgi:hypothetical protein